MPTILKIATVYTASFGNYDSVQEPKEKHPYADYLLFLDRPSLLRGWKQVISQSSMTAAREARKRKCLSHLYTDTEYSIWHDGNIKLDTSPIRLCEMLGDAGIMTFKHPYRACAYQEARACIELGKDSQSTVERQIALYQNMGYPPRYGLCETSLIVRRHTEAIMMLNEAWWAEIQAGSYRDQISLNYVAWKLGIKIKMIEGGRQHSPLLKYWRHNNDAG